MEPEELDHAIVLSSEEDPSDRAHDSRLDLEDRVAALGLVSLIALPAALLAVPAAAAIWVGCGQWSRGYDRVRTVVRTPLDAAKEVVRRNTRNLTPEEQRELDDLLSKV